MSTLEHRPVLMALTMLYHLGAAAKIGGLLYLLVSLHQVPEGPVAYALTDHFSRMATISVAALIAAGAGLSWFCVGSVDAMLGTTYGVKLGAKALLTPVRLGIGGLNLSIVRAIRRGSRSKTDFLTALWRG